jgi:hypothetical protein
MLSSKLTVGVHILTLLALTPDQAQTSEYIAGSVNTNPVERAQPALPGGSQHPGHPYSGLWRGRAADRRAAR